MAGETISSAPLSWVQSWQTPNWGAGILNNGNGTLTFTDGKNYRVTIPGPTDFPDVLPKQGWYKYDQFHLYQYDSRVENSNPNDLMGWAFRNPTANFGNNIPSTLQGTPNDATPTVAPQSWAAAIVSELPSFVYGDNRVHTFVGVNEFTGQPMGVNLTDKSHGLYPGAVLIDSVQNSDGSSTLRHFGIGGDYLQSESYFPVVGQLSWISGFGINSVWWQHTPSDDYPLSDFSSGSKTDLPAGMDVYGNFADTSYFGLDYGSAFTPDLSDIVAGDYGLSSNSFDGPDFSNWTWNDGGFEQNVTVSGSSIFGIDYAQYTGGNDFNFIDQNYTGGEFYGSGDFYDPGLNNWLGGDTYNVNLGGYDLGGDLYGGGFGGYDSGGFDSWNSDYGSDITFDTDFYGDGFNFPTFPILLDLDGNGVKVTELSQSTTYLDSGDDGLAHRTAWAGAGDGVLFYDVGGDNKITEKREYVFTEWDPTATDDMSALRAAFDANGDGKLTAADAAFASFKVMVTNADGTQTAQTLTALGITEIRLTQDATNTVLPDGSVITGQSTFLRSNGITGTVANTTLATESMGYKITKTEANVAGTVTVDIKAFDATGALDHAEKTVTNATGTTRTVSFDNDGDSVWDRLQSIVKTTNAANEQVTAITNKSGGVDIAAIVVNSETQIVSVAANDNVKTIGLAA